MQEHKETYLGIHSNNWFSIEATLEAIGLRIVIDIWLPDAIKYRIKKLSKTAKIEPKSNQDNWFPIRKAWKIDKQLIAIRLISLYFTLKLQANLFSKPYIIEFKQ
jgi:hypothetical protein